MLFTLRGMGNHTAKPPAPRPAQHPARRRLSLTGVFAVIGAAAVLLGTAVGVVETVATAAATVTIPRPDKTVIVVMENHSYNQVIAAPYINSLAGAGANMTDSHGVRHPSEPNYLALWSGSTQGLTDDSCPHTYTGGSLGQQLLSAGDSVAGFFENLPSAGSTVCSASGGYVRKHNPLADFPATTGAATNKPFTAWPASNFANLPDVSLVVPNLNNDMHDGTITTGDNWLRTHIDPYVQWAKTHNSLLILTFDEDDFTAANHIPTILVGPMVNPGSYPETINHYNVLHTVEAAFGLSPLGAAAAPVTDVWKVPGPTSSSPPTTAPATTTAPSTVTSPATATVSATPPQSVQPPPSSTPVTTVTPTTTAPTSTAPSTTAPTTTAAPSTSAPPTSSPPPPPSTPLRGAFYYPWFGSPGAWSQNGIYPYTHYHPTAGFYDSTDPALIAYQVAGMRYAGLDFAVSSWWGQGSREDNAVPAELAAATGGFKWSLYYEAEGNGPDPTVTQIQSDLAYIGDRYAGNPHYLTKAGKPVLFVYGDATDSCSMVDRWVQANADRFYLVLKVFSGYRTCTQQPDSWHQYGPASAADSQKGYSYTISPGFWKAGESTPRLARDETRWQANIASMVASNAPWQLVTTWDEWGEGTSVEDATDWDGNGPFGAYIEDLHRALNP